MAASDLPRTGSPSRAGLLVTRTWLAGEGCGGQAANLIAYALGD